MIILGLSERGRDSEDVQPASELLWKKAKATNRAIDKDLDVFTYDPFKVVFDSTIYIRSRKKTCGAEFSGRLSQGTAIMLTFKPHLRNN